MVELLGSDEHRLHELRRSFQREFDPAYTSVNRDSGEVRVGG